MTVILSLVLVKEAEADCTRKSCFTAFLSGKNHLVAKHIQADLDLLNAIRA